MFLRLRAPARASAELAEAEVAEGDERAHAERVGERQRLAVVACSFVGAARRRDVTGEAEGVGLACPCPQSAGELQRLSGVGGGLVDPPGRMAGRPRAEKNESRPDVPRTMAKLLDSARDQRACLVGTAGKRVGGAEGCGDQRYSDGDLPRDGA